MRARDIIEAEDPKTFLQRHAPLARFEVEGSKNNYEVAANGKVLSVTATSPRVSEYLRRPRKPWRIVKFNADEYQRRTGRPPSGTIPISQISYWVRSGNYYTCGAEAHHRA